MFSLNRAFLLAIALLKLVEHKIEGILIDRKQGLRGKWLTACLEGYKQSYIGAGWDNLTAIA